MQILRARGQPYGFAFAHHVLDIDAHTHASPVTQKIENGALAENRPPRVTAL